MWVLHSPCRFGKCDFSEYPNKMAAWPQREMTKCQKKFLNEILNPLGPYDCLYTQIKAVLGNIKSIFEKDKIRGV